MANECILHFLLTHDRTGSQKKRRATGSHNSITLETSPLELGCSIEEFALCQLGGVKTSYNFVYFNLGRNIHFTLKTNQDK